MTRTRIGVLGAGAMGSGIALAALYADHEVTLTDISPEALDRAKGYIEGHLSRKGLSERADQLHISQSIDAISGSDVVLEAALETLELKQELFAQLDRICPAPCILATNTSTLSVTAIASATATPERVAGMHFFNPAPVLKLVEIAKGASTSQDTVNTLIQLAESMGKIPVVTDDSPGFIVNRVARPFYGEALRLLAERTANHEEIDALLTLGAGFRMGPFELMDLIGLDVNLAAATTMYESTYGEPRYRPHWLQRQMVESGALGRKSGAGFYEYDGDEKRWTPPMVPEIRQASGYILVSDGSWAPEMGRLLGQAGYTMSETHGDLPVAAIVVNGRDEGVRDIVRRYDRGLAPNIPILCQTVDIDLSEVQQSASHPERIVGFDGLFLATGKASTLVAGRNLADEIRAAATDLLNSLGRLPIWVQESSGMISPRIWCCLANEAAFAVGEGIAKSAMVDTAMELGVNYPTGPLAWAEQLGYAKVVAVLDHMAQAYGDERYRVAPWLRRKARESEPRAL
ncbi:MAG: 3-hydroxyacyl-CoA dehydrogenase NAD-binding domain-containing protein [Anaerolineales bacterium]